jgi:hypothetical protein
MATGKKGPGSSSHEAPDREAELEAAIEAIRVAIWKPGQTLPTLRRAIAVILQNLKR